MRLPCRHLAALIAALIAALALASACSKEDVGQGCDLRAGDLVISELMANPLDEDRGHEWIEVYNASSTPQLVDRMQIQTLGVTGGAPRTCTLKDDCSSGASCVGGLCTKSHTVRNAGRVRARSYFVFGDGVVGDAPIQYSYWSDGSQENIGNARNELSNTASGIRLVCQGREIDTIWYGTPGGLPAPEDAEGMSVGFDGGAPPDALRNDDGGLWCSGGETYDGANLGTPGAPNILCGLVSCDDNGTMRDLVSPQLGDLVVTEAMTDPGGADQGRDWIEIYVAGSTAVDLNALMIETQSASGSERSARLESRACVTVQPGQYAVIAGTDDPSGDGSLVPDGIAEGLSFFASGGTVTLRRGPAVFDTVSLLDSSEGRSVSLDGSVTLQSEANDDPAAWCFGSQLYDSENAGTPGAANPACHVVSCLDSGSPRAPVRPGVGELLITELLPNPDGSDSGREWVEVLVTAAAAVDLNGVIVSKSGNVSMATDPLCITVQPGEYRIIGASSAVSIPPDIMAPGMLMAASDGAAELWRGATMIDSAAVPEAKSSATVSLDADLTSDAGNDDAAHWCYGRQVYDGANAGTPGAANATCGLATCGLSGRRPAAGDLLITEVFGNPSGTEAGKEWIEVLVLAAGPIDLSGVIIASSGDLWMAIDPTCVTVQPGEYRVFAASSDTATNGNVTVDIEVPGLALDGSNETHELFRGNVLIDRARTPEALDGVSTSLNPDHLDEAGNDLESSFCKGRTTGVFDEHGTPGMANEVCAKGCFDGLGIRAPVLPGAGELVITEVYANPTGTDNARDWLEVYVAATTGVELNGLVIENQGAGSPRRWTVDALDCITLAAGAYALIGGTSVPTDGVTPDAVFGPQEDPLLLSGPARLALVNGQTIIDEINYEVAVAGTSFTLSGSFVIPDATVNDDFATNWCAAPAARPPFSGIGSPGAANDPCP